MAAYVFSSGTLILFMLGERRNSSVRLSIVALAAAAGAFAGLFAGWLFFGGRVQGTPPAVGVSGARELEVERRPDPVPVDDHAHRLDDLETRIGELVRDLEALKASRSLIAVEEGAPALPPEDVFRARYEQVVVDIIDRDRLNRAISRETDSIHSLVDRLAEEDPEIADQAASLKRIAAGYMERQKEIILTVTPDGTWPVPGDPSRAEWARCWSDLDAWLESELSMALGFSKAQSLMDDFKRDHYVLEW